MTKLHVHNGAWVLVCDGRKALVLRNEGDAELLNLRRAAVRAQENPATRDQGTDAPGKTHAPNGIRSGSLGETDWHTIEEQRFADTIATEINGAVRTHDCKELIVVAPPKTLAELRDHWSTDTRAAIAAELPKDLTHHTIPAIEKLLQAYDA